VDKRDFSHRLNGLRVLLPVEQTLRLDGIETGQKIGGRPSRQFRTFDPVDIQQFIHKAVVNTVNGHGRRRCRRRRRDVAEVEKFFGRVPSSKRVARFTTKSLYTK
jgi:hypothetical protein